MDNNKGMSLFGAMVLGGLVGAAAVFLSRDENRLKLEEKWQAAKQAGIQKKDELASKTRQVVSQGASKISQALEESQDELNKQRQKVQSR